MAYQTAKFAGASRAAAEGPSFSLRAGIAAMMLALAGCGSGSGDESGQPPGGGMPLVATLPSIQANVFSIYCVRCHTGGGAPFGLRLDPEFSAGDLIRVASPRDATLIRVVPGDPDASFLIQKLEGTQAPELGERMPAGGPYLSTSTINVIRQWIQDGAQP
jgi:mono/diheme cytochrome c family protein